MGLHAVSKTPSRRICQVARYFIQRFILFASLTLTLCQSPAAEDSTSPILQQAYAQLLSVRVFAFGDVGRAWTPPCAWTTSQGEHCFSTLAESTNGLPLFKAALTNGTTEARLYGLIGVRHFAPEQFDAFAAPIIASNPPVRFLIGDIGMLMSASNIVAQIKKDAYEDYCPPESSR
jgi:hypothetical protein